MSAIHDPAIAPRRRRMRRIAVATTALALVGGGTAYAWWTTTGSGTGSAATGSTVPIDVVQTTSLTPMYPGDSPQTLSGVFNNNNNGPVHVSSVTVSIASVTGGAGSCSAGDYSLSNATMNVNADVPKGTGVGGWTGATIQFNNKTSNQDGCKGATVNLAYSAS